MHSLPMLRTTFAALMAASLRTSFAALVAAAFALLLVACKPSAPSGIIQPDVLEDLLYDYHVSDALASQAKGPYEQNVVAFHEAVFKKYGVTSAEFDSSMVYYMRHTTQLHDIYEHIAQRLEDEAQAAGSNISLDDASTTQTQGDTLDLWKDARSLVLMPQEPFNLVSFHLTPDAKATAGDDYLLTLHTDFIFQDGMRDAVVVMAIVYANDSVSARTTHISSSGQQQLVLTDGDSLGVKEVRGYFMMARNNPSASSATTLRLASIDHIRLLRCHRKADNDKTVKVADSQPAQTPSKPADSLKPKPADTLKPQTAPAVKARPGAPLKLQPIESRATRRETAAPADQKAVRPATTSSLK